MKFTIIVINIAIISVYKRVSKANETLYTYTKSWEFKIILRSEY